MTVLHVVATPIGNLSDMSDRAREILRACPTIVAEDTRRTRQLLNTIESSARLISLNEHNVSRRIGPILELLTAQDIALVSDAGTPAISDPGYQLVAAAHEAGVVVRPVPGPSAVVAALSVAGLPATPFTFLGYAPRGHGELKRWIEEWLGAGTTVVFFEGPGRMSRCIGAIADADSECTVVICRELTKVFEQVLRGRAGDVRVLIEDGTVPARGEFVIVAKGSAAGDDVDEDLLLQERLTAGDGPNQAAKQVSAVTGISKSDLYKRALELKSRHSV